MDGAVKREYFRPVKNDVNGRLMPSRWRLLVVATFGRRRCLLLDRWRCDDGEGGGADVRGALFEVIESDASGEHVWKRSQRRKMRNGMKS